MVGQVAGHGQLASVQRRVAKSVDPVARRELQGDEVAAGAADDDLAVDDVHACERGYGRCGCPVLRGSYLERFSSAGTRRAELT